MEIIQDLFNKTNYLNSSLFGNLYKVCHNNQIYYYEFLINNNTATINYNNPEYLDLVVDEYRKTHEYITVYKTQDNTFYANYEKVYSFKLPIKCIQVSENIINENRIKALVDIVEPNDIHLAVIIHNDEYILVGDHHLLYALYEIGEKMVNVYMSTKIDYEKLEFIKSMVYVYKENNIMNINNIELIDEKSYQTYIKLLNEFNITK